MCTHHQISSHTVVSFIMGGECGCKLHMLQVSVGDSFARHIHTPEIAEEENEEEDDDDDMADEEGEGTVLSIYNGRALCPLMFHSSVADKRWLQNKVTILHTAVVAYPGAVFCDHFL